MPITDLYSKVLNNIDEGYFSCCIFLDLSNAFDTVNHQLLLNKLHWPLYGIRGNVHDLLVSYLANRQQFTECNDIRSKTSAGLCGVLQGSTLGPLLFSIYIYDLPNHTTFHATLFVDDTVINEK